MSFYQGQHCGEPSLSQAIVEGVPGREVARVAAVGQTTLCLLGRGRMYNPSFDKEVAQCHEEILIGRYVGVEMTQFRKNNLAAAIALQQLPVCFTATKQVHTPADSPNTIWSGVTRDTLMAINCVTQQDRPTPALRLAMPFLQLFSPPRYQVDMERAKQMLPENARRPFRKMWGVSQGLARQLPIVMAQQTGWELPTTIDYYNHLTLNNASAYLANLLSHIFELNAKLQETDDDLVRGHFIY